MISFPLDRIHIFAWCLHFCQVLSKTDVCYDILRNFGLTKRFRCTFNFSSAFALWLVFHFNFSHSTHLMYVTTFVFDDGKIAVSIHGFVAVCFCWNFFIGALFASLLSISFWFRILRFSLKISRWFLFGRSFYIIALQLFVLFKVNQVFLFCFKEILDKFDNSNSSNKSFPFQCQNTHTQPMFCNFNSKQHIYSLLFDFSFQNLVLTCGLWGFFINHK